MSIFWSRLQASCAVDLLLHLRLLVEQRVDVGVGLGEGGRDRVEAVEQVAQLADAVLDVAAHVLRRVELRLLREVPDGRPGRSSAMPPDGSSRPAMMRSSVDLPAPFGPSTPIFAPGRNESVMLVEHLAIGP